MEFSEQEQYLTLSEYESMGGSLEPTPFNLLEYEARRKIDGRTQNRLKKVDIDKIPNEVKACEFALINSIKSYASTTENITEKGNVASENTDGYSVSFITPTQIQQIVISKNTELNDIIKTYLLGVEVNNEYLLFLGVENDN